MIYISLNMISRQPSTVFFYRKHNIYLIIRPAEGNYTNSTHVGSTFIVNKVILECSFFDTRPWSWRGRSQGDHKGLPDTAIKPRFHPKKTQNDNPALPSKVSTRLAMVVGAGGQSAVSQCCQTRKSIVRIEQFFSLFLVNRVIITNSFTQN